MLESAVSKLLHAPTTRLKERAAEGEDARELAAAVRFLFDLQELGVASAQLEAARPSPRAKVASRTED